MSTDRELLELAAKAAGLFLVGYDDVNLKCIAATEMPIKNIPFVWNPLTDDGDALRLAVKLGIDTLITNSTKSIVGETTTFGPFEDETGVASDRYAEDHGADPYAATRRAIVRAAAEIGKSK